MKHEERVNILLLLVQNLNVFAWSPYVMTDVDLEFISHKLNVDSTFPLEEAKAEEIGQATCGGGEIGGSKVEIGWGN